MRLGEVILKTARQLDLTGTQKSLSTKSVDREFKSIQKLAMLGELVALNALPQHVAEKLALVSEDQARSSLNRLDSLERNRPTVGQVARYGAIGGIAAPLAGAASNLIRGKSPFEGTGLGGKLREVAAKGIGGAVTGGAVPLLRSHLDRKAELGTLRSYLTENSPQGV